MEILRTIEANQQSLINIFLNVKVTIKAFLKNEYTNYLSKHAIKDCGVVDSGVDCRLTSESCELKSTKIRTSQKVESMMIGNCEI